MATTLPIRGFVSGLLVTRGLGGTGVVVADLTSFIDPRAATISTVGELDEQQYAIDPRAASFVQTHQSAIDPRAATITKTITLEVFQGSAFARVIQAMDRSGNPPLYFLATDTLTGAIWNGQTQALLFNPAVAWFTGLAEIDVLSGGSGYSSSPTVTITGGGATTQATAVATVLGGVIAEIAIASPGTGYTSTPTVSITDSTGTGATASGTPAMGYKSGQVLVTMTAAQTTGLDTMGQYRFQATATRTSPTVLIDCLVRAFPSPGASTQMILTYNSYQDMLDIASWITGLQDVDVDMEGFYSQRLRARLWLDDICVNKSQNNYTGQFGAHSESAFSALGGFQSIAPDMIIRDALAANQLILRPAVVQVCAHYAVGLVGLGQIMSGSKDIARMGQYHLTKANRDVLAITAEIDSNNDGVGEMFINLSTINTMLG